MANNDITPSSSLAAKMNRRRAVGPRDDWSAIASWPEQIALDVELERRIEITAAIPKPKNYPQEAYEARILSALDRMRDIDPGDAMESMLATLMVSTHATAMDCMRRANEVSDINPKLYGAYLNYAARLQSLFLKQMSTMDKHRGKGEQKVTVEHVHVGQGGNAIVGHIETSASRYPLRNIEKERPEQKPAKSHAPRPNKEAI